MKKHFIAWLLICSTSLIAQIGYKVEYRLKVYSSDNYFQKSLIKACHLDETFEGSFSDNHLFRSIPGGKLQKGGFTFLDSDVYGFPLDALKKDWLKNGATEIMISTFDSAPKFRKALSFQISALPDPKKKDSLHIYFKYSTQTLIDSTKIFRTEFDLNVKLNYKHFILPIGKEIQLDFLHPLFKGYKFSLLVDYYREEERIMPFKPDEAAINKLLQSGKESIIKNNQINFNASFYRRNLFPNSQEEGAWVQSMVEIGSTPMYSSIDNQKGILNAANPVLSRYVKLENPVYYCNFEVPFLLVDKYKKEKYSAYKTLPKYFVSNYNLVIIPISFSNEGIIADVLIDYAKLNLEDDFKRWTTISKRITIPYKSGVKIEIPKENWTANFSREGEKYEIFGLSDYEKYFNEIITITIN
jgi:hypothetical protein